MKITTNKITSIWGKQPRDAIFESPDPLPLKKATTSAIRLLPRISGQLSTSTPRTCPAHVPEEVRERWLATLFFPTRRSFSFSFVSLVFFMICWFLSESFSLYPCYSRFMFALCQIFFSYIVEIYLSIFSPYHLAFFCCLSVCIDEDLVTILSFSLRVSFIITHLFENWKKITSRSYQTDIQPNPFRLNGIK